MLCLAICVLKNPGSVPPAWKDREKVTVMVEQIRARLEKIPVNVVVESSESEEEQEDECDVALQNTMDSDDSDVDSEHPPATFDELAAVYYGTAATVRNAKKKGKRGDVVGRQLRRSRKSTKRHRGHAGDAGAHRPPKAATASSFVDRFGFCKKDGCSSYKPDRAHHCATCQRCILKFDHHCVLINNCVGFYNYKPYLLLLIYAMLSLVLAISGLIPFCIHLFDALPPSIPIAYPLWVRLQVPLMAFLLVAIAVMIGLLLAMHVGLVITNVTTLEMIRERKGFSWRTLIWESAYHLGVIRNLQEVFGTNLLLWPFPTYLTVPDRDGGISFPCRKTSRHGGSIV